MEQLSEQNFSLRMYMCFLLTYTLMFPFLKNHEIENIQRTIRGGCSQMSCKKIASENFGKFTGKSLGFCQLRILTLSMIIHTHYWKFFRRYVNFQWNDLMWNISTFFYESSLEKVLNFLFIFHLPYLILQFSNGGTIILML